ncbi:Flp/Fap pilin component [Roseovarius albus]|uniref:Flp/Fap pilin component n=1 Tax=Roseovarius albus TaxID=1247867 RepID=A0A1X7A9G9_9RHOB|nr:hypothetical protein [Roseovarius albus]SLN73296.1 Flp/Fap pilin component [Roseovarius albus]
MEQFKKLLGRFRRDEKGVTLVEYGVAVALAVGLGVAALDNLATDVGDAMDAAGDEMPNTQ